MQKYLISLALASTATSGVGLAKTTDYDRQIEAQLAIMDKNSHYHGEPYDDDKVSAASDKIDQMILQWANRQDFFAAPLKRAQAKGLAVADSSDHKLRVFTWDTLSGGSAHFYTSVFQYRVSPTKIVAEDLPSKEEGDLGACYDKVKTIRTVGGENIYLLCGSTIGSNIDQGCVVAAYAIQKGKLKPVKMFKTKTKLLDSVSCFALPKSDDERAEIEFADQDKTMKVPLNTDTKFTGKYLIYKFDGQKFAFIGTGK